ncbi:hypothetical protein KJE20_14165 [Pyrenophora tritici-repentis]|nr:hypothetical protein KJE20_14165 [Pyrenophora tritici-repentis]
MPDPAILVVLRMLVPQIPQLLIVTAKHTLGMSSTSGKTDLQTVITVHTLRTFYSKEKKSQPISQLQAGMMQERGVRGNMWVATSTIPRPPDSDQDGGGEFDLRNAIFEAVDSLSQISGKTLTTYTKPQLEDLEVEWVGYRAKPGKETLTEAEKYHRLMNEPSRTTDVTILYFHGGGWYNLQALAQQQDAHEITAEEIEQMLIPESLKQHKYTIKLWIE